MKQVAAEYTIVLLWRWTFFWNFCELYCSFPSMCLNYVCIRMRELSGCTVYLAGSSRLIKSNKHRTQEERYTIERMRKEGYKQVWIAECLDRDPGTVSREIRRNSGQRGCRHKQAQRKAEGRRFSSRRRIKFTPVMRQDRGISVRWLKPWASYWSDASPSRGDCQPWTYLPTYVCWPSPWASLYKHLRQCRKKRRKRLGRQEATWTQDRRGRIQNRFSIEERSPIVEKRFYYGGWEVDLVEGRRSWGLYAEFSRTQVRAPADAPSWQQEGRYSHHGDHRGTLPFVSKIRSLKMDNGKEFSGHGTVTDLMQTKVYFAHPYASWERGTNENTNGLVRQYLPKGMSFRNLEMALCRQIERKLSLRPRKRLSYVAPMDWRNKLIASWIWQRHRFCLQHFNQQPQY